MGACYTKSVFTYPTCTLPDNKPKSFKYDSSWTKDEKFLKAAEYGDYDTVSTIFQSYKENQQRLERRSRYAQCSYIYSTTKALMIACQYGHINIVRLLIANTEINRFDKKEMSPLMYACKYNFDNIVTVLIRYGADVNRQNVYKMTALLKAARYGSSNAVAVLLDHDADVNISDFMGQTALIKAARQGYESVVDMLLEHGADVNHKDNNMCSAVDYAMKHSHTEIALALAVYGSNISVEETPVKLDHDVEKKEDVAPSAPVYDILTHDDEKKEDVVPSAPMYDKLDHGDSNNNSEPVSTSDVNVNVNTKDTIDESKLCVVCCDNEKNMLFLNCKHVATCKDCCSQLDTCPICRKPKTETMAIFC